MSGPIHPVSRPIAVRRSPHLLSYWSDEGMVTWNYATGLAVLNDPS